MENVENKYSRKNTGVCLTDSKERMAFINNTKERQLQAALTADLLYASEIT